MYRGFRRSRIVMGVTLALTVALTVFVWMRNRGRAVYIPVLASVLLLGIGCTAARLLGNITASVACTGMLGILHMDLDPEAFLEQFLPVARRIPGESRDGMVCRFYLSDSYFAAGRYAEAKSVLGELPARFYTSHTCCYWNIFFYKYFYTIFYVKLIFQYFCCLINNIIFI